MVIFVTKQAMLIKISPFNTRSLLMKLFFLGKAYNASMPAIEGSETQETVTFLGRQSRVKQFNVAHHQSAGEQLTFLGRHYTR
jgi:hypothetical protein